MMKVEEEEEVAISLRFLGDDGACDRSGLQPEVKKSWDLYSINDMLVWAYGLEIISKMV